MLSGVAVLAVLTTFVGVGQVLSSECPASIVLDSTQFKWSNSVSPWLISSGPTSVYLLHPSDGGFGYSVERIGEVVGGGEARAPDMVTLLRTDLDSRIEKLSFANPGLLGVHWREVGVAASSGGDEFTVTPGVYRLSILVSGSKPKVKSEGLHLCRIYSQTFLLTESERWVPFH